MSSKKLRAREFWGTTASVGLRFYDSMAEEELLAEKLEPEKGFVGGKRSRDDPPVVRRLSKADTCDPSFEQIPENVDREKFLCMMAEMLIRKVFAEVIVSHEIAKPSDWIHTAVLKVMRPCFDILEVDEIAHRVTLGYIHRKYPLFSKVKYFGLSALVLESAAWRFDLVMEVLEVLQAAQRRGELDKGIVTGIVEILNRWMPEILARLEQLGAEPGASSRRLNKAIELMRERVRRVKAWN